jgi:hypothetical protein
VGGLLKVAVTAEEPVVGSRELMTTEAIVALDAALMM